MKVKELMREEVFSLFLDDYVKPIDLLKKASYSTVPVINRQKQVVGVISLKDLLKGLEIKYKVSDIMRKDFSKLYVFDKINIEMFLDMNCSFPIIVVDKFNVLKGVLTEQKIIQALSEEYENIKRILNNVDEGLIAVDKKGKVIFFNEKWLNIHHLDSEEVLGKAIVSKLPETKLIKILENGKPLEEGPLYFKQTGATVIPTYKPLLDKRHQVVGAFASVKKLSEINELTIKLRELKKLKKIFSLIFNTLSEGVFAVNDKKQIIYANPAFIKMFDQQVDQKIESQEINDLIDQILLKGKPIMSREVKIDKRQLSILIKGIPLTSPNDVVRGCVCIIQDVTDIKRLNNKLRRTNKQLEKAKNLANFYELEINKKFPISEDIVCKNKHFKNVMAIAHKVAPTSVTVLISGENGVGKEMVARFIHFYSERKDQPFITVNCAAIPEPLWESEMFGYEEGAFTGARKGGKPGKFELADGGTIFLDEIGEIPISAQAKLLRILQNMEVERIGSTKTKKVNVRIIAATNRNIEEMVAKKKFREDLYYRLNVVRLHIPPLRERPEEIVPLINYFLRYYNKKYKKNIVISAEARKILKEHNWPGNIRELKNVIEHAVVLAEKEILPIHLPQFFDSFNQNQKERVVQVKEVMELSKIIEEAEKQAFERALKKANFNKTKAIKILNISRRTFYKKLRKYNLEKNV